MKGRREEKTRGRRKREQEMVGWNRKDKLEVEHERMEEGERGKWRGKRRIFGKSDEHLSPKHHIL